jgi:hypothetical protein
MSSCPVSVKNTFLRYAPVKWGEKIEVNTCSRHMCPDFVSAYGRSQRVLLILWTLFSRRDRIFALRTPAYPAKHKHTQMS